MKRVRSRRNLKRLAFINVRLAQVENEIARAQATPRLALERKAARLRRRRQRAVEAAQRDGDL